MVAVRYLGKFWCALSFCVCELYCWCSGVFDSWWRECFWFVVKRGASLRLGESDLFLVLVPCKQRRLILLVTWRVLDTRQRSQVCRVSGSWHSAKEPGLPSVRSGTLGKRAVTVSAPSCYFFSPSVGFSSRQSICRVPDRKHSAKRRLPTL